MIDEAHLTTAMRLSRLGDPKGHRALLMLCRSLVMAYLGRRLGRDHPDCEDLVQECLLAVHNRRDSYDPKWPVSAWVHAIARYKLIDHYRRKGQRVHVPLDDYTDILAAVENDPVAARDLEALLADLPMKQQDLVRDVKLKGLSLQEAGDKQGLSVNTAKVSLHRALQSLMRKVRNNAE